MRRNTIVLKKMRKENVRKKKKNCKLESHNSNQTIKGTEFKR
jgi:hypothetical protein